MHWQTGCKVSDVTALVKTIPGAELISNVGTELAFRLPMDQSAAFPTMLHQVWPRDRSYAVSVC